MIKRLFTEIDIASLVFFRILYGILAFADIMGLWTYYHLWEGDFDPNGFQFKYYGFEWVQPIPEPFMSIFFLCLLSAAVLITIGYKYRAATTFLFFGFTYVFLLEKTHYLNHGYLFCWLSFVMIWIPANREFSKDVIKKPSLRRHTIPYYNLFILQFFMATVYFFGGIAKINADWLLSAMPLQQWIGYKADMPILGWLWGQELTAYIMAWAGMLLDLLVVFFLFFRRTRMVALFFLLGFHLTNTIIFKIGIFPWLSIGLTLLFFPPARPRLWLERAEKKLKFIPKVKTWWANRIGLEELEQPLPQETWPEVFAAEKMNASSFPQERKVLVLSALALLVLIHWSLPLRQHLYPGPTAWTEEGHRYAWRMMLRQKNGYGNFIVQSPNLEKEIRVRPEEYLSKKQRRKMYTHPDMILQFAHHIRDKYTAEGLDSVQVYAKVRTRLNGRTYQDYVDKTVDLAQIEWSMWEHSDWIVPFKNTEIKKKK